MSIFRALILVTFFAMSSGCTTMTTTSQDLSMSDRALLNMARDATKLVAQRGFFKLEENEDGLD